MNKEQILAEAFEREQHSWADFLNGMPPEIIEDLDNTPTLKNILRTCHKFGFSKGIVAHIEMTRNELEQLK